MGAEKKEADLCWKGRREPLTPPRLGKESILAPSRYYGTSVLFTPAAGVKRGCGASDGVRGACCPQKQRARLTGCG